LKMCKISDDVIAAITTRGKIYEVGGAVRDRMLDRNPDVKDRDYLVCGIPFGELSRILGGYGEVDLVGRSFGVIKFTQRTAGGRCTFDVSLPRREYSIGVGHKDFSVSFDPALSVEDDLRRRDFTINAMAVPLGEDRLIDPFGGRSDLEKRLIRMVSPKAFEEDPLRMLRAVQFAARFDFNLEETTEASIAANAALIGSVSPERINEEFNKMLVRSERPSDGFRLMHQTGLLKHILPEVAATVGVEQPGGYHAYDVFEHTLHTIDASPPVLHIRLAALFHDIAKPQTREIGENKATFYGHEKIGARVAVKILRRLRYSNELIHRVATLVDRHMFTTDVTDKGRRRLIRRVGQDLIFGLLDLRRADIIAQGKGGSLDEVDDFEKEIREEIERRPPFKVKDLAVNGHDLMKAFDLEPSPLLGRILNYLLETVLDHPEENERDRLIELAGQYLSNMNENDKINQTTGDG